MIFWGGARGRLAGRAALKAKWFRLKCSQFLVNPRQKLYASCNKWDWWQVKAKNDMMIWQGRLKWCTDIKNISHWVSIHFDDWDMLSWGGFFFPVIANLEMNFARPHTFDKMARVRIRCIHRWKYIFRVGIFIPTLQLGNRVIIWAPEAAYEGQTQENWW